MATNKQGHKKLPIKLKNMSVQAYWSLDLNSQVCKLCQKHLMNATQEEIENRSINNTMIVGKCGCGFHKRCMDQWLKSGNKFCPVDNSNWKEVNTTDLSVIWNNVST